MISNADPSSLHNHYPVLGTKEWFGNAFQTAETLARLFAWISKLLDARPSANHWSGTHVPLHPWILFLNGGKSRSFSVAEVDGTRSILQITITEPHACIIE